MPLRKDTDEKYIIEKLGQLQSVVALSNSQQLYDIDHTMEAFCTGLLNIIFGWELRNINNEMKNTPAIDLGDEKQRIAVQVTSDKSGEKVKKTISSFLENNMDKKYTRLIVMMLVQKQGSYSFNYSTEGRISFSIRNDIIDFSDLLTWIKKNDKLHTVRKYIEREFPDCYKKVDLEIFDRIKGIINSIESGHERDVALEIELFFDHQIKTEYSRLLELLDMQSDRKELLDFYDLQLRDILAEEGTEEEYDMLLEQSCQYDYYEPLYRFCEGYSFITQIPYDCNRSEVIDYRAEQEEFFARNNDIDKVRKNCILMIKDAAKKML